MLFRFQVKKQKHKIKKTNQQRRMRLVKTNKKAKNKQNFNKLR
jgi:hypothetical protein